MELVNNGVPAQQPVLAELYKELKKWYHKNVNVPYKVGQYDWSFNVTDKVKQVIYGVRSAYLIGWYRIIKYQYVGQQRPPKRSTHDIVEGWKNGVEVALLHMPQGWYYVYVPCRLVVVTSRGLFVFPAGAGGRAKPSHGGKPILALGLVAALYILWKRR